MDIKTKYSLGDKVWFFDGEAKEMAEIISIQIHITSGYPLVTVIQYAFHSIKFDSWYREDDLYATLDEIRAVSLGT